uniref:Tail protein n=1 Tax=viral metagenome TaxID=1070528 RepID=A0A6M3IDV3_9ZZZZ
MPLNPLAKAINIKRSLEYYISTYLGTSESLKVEYEGVPFDSMSVTEWVTPRILDSNPVFVRQSSDTDYGEDVNLLFQTNIHVKKSSNTTADRHYVMRDIVVDYFKIGTEIDINDWASGSGTSLTEHLKVRSIVNDSMLPETDTTYEYILAFELTYTRSTTK